jgi:nitrite reductase/ring-hydroxylating ferredoxin subunit
MTELREWPVCRLDQLADPGAREFFTGDGDWPFRGLVVQRRGAIFAYANVCPHRGHPLNLVEHDFLLPDGSLLRCASHGALFVPESGFCLAGPCASENLSVLECRVSDGVVMVRAPETADR